MPFVVKIADASGNVSRWIGCHTLCGARRVVPRDEARVFESEEHATRAIEGFRDLMPDTFRFEIESA
jgi:hypothetical protein